MLFSGAESIKCLNKKFPCNRYNTDSKIDKRRKKRNRVRTNFQAALKCQNN